MRFINKAGLLAGALTTLLILASCSDSDTSTGVTTGKQLANDSSTEVVMHQGTAGTGEHSNPDTNHGHSPDQQHAEPNNPTTSSVVALLSISNPICGNLIQEDGEQCDGGLGGNATCNTDCTLKTQRGEVIATTACGNGIVDPGEQCDDANDSNEDDCTRFCKTPVCGDGYVQGSNGEQCDDKNRIDTDGCNNACQSSTTTVVTTTTVIEEVNDDGGTTRTSTTTTPPDTTPTATTVIEEVNDDGGTTTTTPEAAICSRLCEQCLAGGGTWGKLDPIYDITRRRDADGMGCGVWWQILHWSGLSHSTLTAQNASLFAPPPIGVSEDDYPDPIESPIDNSAEGSDFLLDQEATNTKEQCRTDADVAHTKCTGKSSHKGDKCRFDRSVNKGCRKIKNKHCGSVRDVAKASCNN